MEYSPLNYATYQLRLLHIFPASEDESSSVPTCMLRDHYTLINPPVYHALSYTWGDPSITEPIIINDTTVYVTVNLASALRVLQPRGKNPGSGKLKGKGKAKEGEDGNEVNQQNESDGALLIWVDALCINQQDIAERGLQVLRMGMIYSQACQIDVWLGEATQDSGVALDFLRWGASDAGRVLSRRNHSDMSTREAQGLAALGPFFERPYWRRVWIIQEVAMGAVVQLYCGTNMISWLEVCEAIGRIQASLALSLALSVEVLEQVEDPEELDSLTGLRSFEGLYGFRIAVQEHRSSWPSLIEALYLSRPSLATDSRDKIYGVLGLTSDGQELVPTPNYIQSINEVLVSMTRNMIQHKNRLEPILFQGKNALPRRKKLSWVPDWLSMGQETKQWPLASLQGPKPPIPGKSIGEDFATQEPWYFNVFSCNVDTLNECPSSIYHFEETSLWIEGAVFDVIDGLSTTPESLRSPGDIPLLEAVQESYHNTKYTSWRDEWTGLAILRSLMMEDRSKIQGPLPRDLELAWLWEETTVRYMAASQSQFYEWLLANEGFVVNGKPLRSWASFKGKSSVAKKPRPQGIRNYVEDLVDRAAEVLRLGMRFLSTEKGYVGMSVQEAQKGDLVCLSRGCGLPLVLRGDDATGYRLIGEAYVDSLMWGEVFHPASWSNSSVAARNKRVRKVDVEGMDWKHMKIL